MMLPEYLLLSHLTELNILDGNNIYPDSRALQRGILHIFVAWFMKYAINDR